MRKKIMAVVVSLITALTLFTSLFPMRAGAVTVDEMTTVAVQIITANEGSYGSVNANDHGAVSLGILQWHADRALALMRAIASNDTASAESLLGTTFYQEVMSVSSWASRTFSSDEAAAAVSLLTSSAGVSVQDATAYSDVQSYIGVGQSYGITDGAALVYFAELYNRGSAIAARVVAAAGSDGGITLSSLHNAALADSSNASGAYTSRLTAAYNTIVSLGWTDTAETVASDGEEEEEVFTQSISATSTFVETPEEQTQTMAVAVSDEDFSEGYAGEYVVDASSLNVRSAPDASAQQVDIAYEGETLNVLSADGTWAKVDCGDNTGYCAMAYLVAIADENEDEDVSFDAEEEVEVVTFESELTLEGAAEPEEDEYVEDEYVEDEYTEDEYTEDESIEDESIEDESIEDEYVEDEYVEETPVRVQNPEEVETCCVSDASYATCYGDVNGDGEVTMIDAILLRRYLDGYTLLDAQQLANADCYRDDVLGEDDINVIVQYVTQNLTALPIV